MKKPVSFWQPVKSSKSTKLNPSVSIFNPIKSKSKSSPPRNPFQFGLTSKASKGIKTPFGLKVVSFIKPVGKNVKKKNMTWEQASIRYPGLSPYRDADRDGVPNFFDCRPFDKKRHLVLKYSRAAPRGVKQTVSKFFQENPELREEGEQLSGKKIFWKFEEPKVTYAKSGKEVARRIYKADFREEKRTPPTVSVSAYPKEQIPTSIKKALEFKKEVEEKRQRVTLPRETREEVLQNMIQGKESAPPRILQGKYAKDVIKNLMEKEGIKSEEASPNVVADFAYDKGFKDLKSEDIVNISDTYEPNAIEEVSEQAPPADIIEESMEEEEENY
jgi:hypothetical protein